MGTLSPILPTVGDPNSTEDVDVRNALTALYTLVNGNIDTANLAVAAALLDAQLAAPNNSVFRRIATAAGYVNGGGGANTFMFLKGGKNITLSGGAVTAAGTNDTPEFFALLATDLAVTTKTTKVRVKGQVASNATAAAMTFTFGLYPITVAGAVNAINVTLGTVVTGTTAAVASPSASTVTTAVSSEVTLPADGAYALGVAQSASPAANSMQLLTAALDVRNT